MPHEATAEAELHPATVSRPASVEAPETNLEKTVVLWLGIWGLGLSDAGLGLMNVRGIWRLLRVA